MRAARDFSGKVPGRIRQCLVKTSLKSIQWAANYMYGFPPPKDPPSFSHTLSSTDVGLNGFRRRPLEVVLWCRTR